MKHIAVTLAVLLPLTAGCSPTPTSASSFADSSFSSSGSSGQSGTSSVASLSPINGPVDTRVTIRGSGFGATGNMVTFGAGGVRPSGMPENPGVIPDLTSPDGATITFSVPTIWRPACSYPGPGGPCPFAQISTAPGVYGVTVTSANGRSNTMTFQVTP